ncbi:MAG: alpha/beta hydrolase [Sandaracinaceae bacterium]|nr:alpha/beta hydrolase [Sandaracinaceae bacterium]
MRVLDASLLLVLALAGCADSGDDGHLVPHTVLGDPSLPRFALADGRLVHLRTFGDPEAPVVVVLHGGPGGDHRDYLHLEAWAERFFVVLWDQRGTGLSERVPDEELDGPTYLADLDYLGETFSPGRPLHLVGHSWGGAYATYYAQRFPARVATLVLVEPGALDATAARRANVVSVDFGAGGFQEFLNTTDYLLPDADARADYFYVIALAGMKEDVELLGYDFWRLGYRANLGINRWQGNFDGSYSFDFTTGLDAFEGQVLFVTGTSEGRLGHAFQMSEHVPRFAGARVLHLPDATHSELLRLPESLEAIGAFLEEAR